MRRVCHHPLVARHHQAFEEPSDHDQNTFPSNSLQVRWGVCVSGPAHIPGFQLVAQVPEGDSILTMTVWKDRLVVASQSGVWMSGADGKLYPVEFVRPDDPPSPLDGGAPMPAPGVVPPNGGLTCRYPDATPVVDLDGLSARAWNALLGARLDTVGHIRWFCFDPDNWRPVGWDRLAKIPNVGRVTVEQIIAELTGIPSDHAVTALVQDTKQ